MGDNKKLKYEDLFGTDQKSESLLPKQELTYENLWGDGGDFAEPGSEEALAGYVGQETLGEPGLEDAVTRGRISAADTINEKFNEFRLAYPDGDLVFVPGKKSDMGILEGVPSNKAHGEILFRKDKSEQYAKLDADFLSKPGNEILSDLVEFFYDDIGVISGEIMAGSNKVKNFIKPFAKFIGGKIPYVGPFIESTLLGYDLWPLIKRVGLYGAIGEFTQEGIQEARGVNEQTFGEIADSAGFKSLIGMVGTAALEPIVRRFMNVMKGRGLLKRSDQAGEALEATDAINKILKDLQILDSKGELIQIPALPANLLVDNPLVQKMGKQVAATGGLLSGQYIRINEALSVALQSVGDSTSAAKLLNLLDIATQMEKKRLFDLSHAAATGSLKLNNVNKATRDFLLKKSGVKDLKDLTMADAAQIIKESMEAMTQPNGILDAQLNHARIFLLSQKPNGVKLDLDGAIRKGTEINFGINQRKKLLEGTVEDLREIIEKDHGQDRLADIDNKVSKILDDLDPDTDPGLIEQISQKEYTNYLTKLKGSDPLINIKQSGATLERISQALRDMDPAGGNVALPTGAVDQTAIGAEQSTLDFLLDARKQLADIRFSEIGNVTKDQRRNAQDLMDIIDDTIKSPSNADAGWAQAYETLVRMQDDQLKMMNLPIIQSLSSEGKYPQLLKGYMDPHYSLDEITMLLNTMDDKGKAAFKQGFFNQLVGNENTMMQLPERLAKYDKKVLAAMFDRPTVTALENLSGFMKKMKDGKVFNVLEQQNQWGRALDELITQKETKRIGEVLDFFKNHSETIVKDGKDVVVKGWDSPLGKALHQGLINRLFTKSTHKVKGRLVLDQPKFRAFVENLKETGIFDTLPKDYKALLNDVDLVKDFIVQGGDAGTSIEAASLAEAMRGVITRRTEIGPFLWQLAEIFGMGKILTSKGGRWFLVGEGGKQFKPATVSRVMSGILATLAAPDDRGISDLEPLLNILPGVGNKDETGTKETSMRMAPTSNISFDQPPIVPESRIAKANPVGMIGSPAGVSIDPNLMAKGQGAGSADPNTYAKGVELFGKNPREITFANQGGIMSTNKAFQRVA